jgi:2-C-methyl-D-erythritol 4-phosphate cytidylyltransferase
MKASDDGISATDDTALATIYALDVYLTKGLYSNLKITTPEDIAIASEIVRSRGESEPFHD